MTLNRATLLHPALPGALLLVYAFIGWAGHPLFVSIPVTLALIFWTLLAAAWRLLRGQ